MKTAFFLRQSNNRRAKLLLVLMIAASLVACQPPDSAESDITPDGTMDAPADTPIVINDDTVMMPSDYIINIKTSRYQPSLGLQGVTEPIRQSKFRAVKKTRVDQVLVTKGQWVEKGTPLLIVEPIDQPTATKATNNEASKSPAASNGSVDPTQSSGTKPRDNAANDLLNSDSSGNELSNSKSSSNESSPSDSDTDRLNQTTDNDTDSDSETLDLKSPNRPSLDEVETTSSSADKSSKMPSASDNRNHANNANKDTAAPNPSPSPKLITVRASFSGRIKHAPKQGAVFDAGSAPLLTMSDDSRLRFVATLPMQAKPQLSVGQTVNFSAQGLKDTFSGQVSNLIAGDKSDELLVYVHVIDNEASRSKLTTDMPVSGRVNYGQIEVGTIVPKRGIHDTNLDALESPPHRPVAPLTANVWIIKQDQRLTRQPVEVIEYDPSTKQYLVAGISNDSLICLADLPVESAGKKVVVP